MKTLFYIYGWILVRPRRWFFWKMICANRLQLKFKRNFFGMEYPNIHWWLLYISIFKVCRWMYWDAWKKFCKYENGWLVEKPLIARIIHRIGSTTAGMAISGGECYHCGSIEGDQYHLNESKDSFELTDSGECFNGDYVSHWFTGITTCPVCGYRKSYGDSS